MGPGTLMSVCNRRPVQAPGQVRGVERLAEVRACNDLRRRRLLRCKVAQAGAEQADAVRAERSLTKLVDDAQRPAPWDSAERTHHEPCSG